MQKAAQTNFITQFFKQLSFSINGLWLIFKHERHFRLESLIAIIVIILGIVLGVTYFEWLSLLLVIALVLMAEAINSAVEALCDTVADEYRLNIKYAKDVTAGAVLLTAMVSVLVGLTVFTPYLWNIFVSVLSLL